MNLKTVLGFLAFVLQVVGYVLYIFQAQIGASDPNLTSWSIIMFLTILNLLTYAQSNKSIIKSLQYLAGAIMSSIVCITIWTTAHFSSLNIFEYATIILCLVAVVIWIKTRAAYANMFIGIAIFIAFIPTFVDIYNGAKETAAPWYIWSCADIVTLFMAYVYRHEAVEVHWKYTAVVPALLLALHSAVAIMT